MSCLLRFDTCEIEKRSEGETENKSERFKAPGKVIRTSQFSVGTVFIQDLWDMMCLPACSSRFPNSLSEKQNAQRDGERIGTVSHIAMLLWTNRPTASVWFFPHALSASFKCRSHSPWNMRGSDITEHSVLESWQHTISIQYLNINNNLTALCPGLCVATINK